MRYTTNIHTIYHTVARTAALLLLTFAIAVPARSQIGSPNPKLQPGPLSGEALKTWRDSYATFKADSLLAEQYFANSVKAEKAGHMRMADSLWFLGHNLVTKLRTFVDDVKRTERLQSAKVIQTAALQHKLDADNAQRALSNKLLEEKQRQTRIHEDSAKSALERAKLKEQRLSVQKAERAHSQALQEAQMKQQKEQDRILLLWLAISIGTVVLFLLIFFLVRRYRINKQVRERNAILEVERDKAHAAEKMKSFFIQNMSHEIRTPLNAIVGFAEMLTIPNMELSEEERDQVTKLIHQNSDQLTTLVSDILDISNLQSGAIRLQRDSHTVNDLCRYAASTVRHQVPPGVELSFTTELDDAFCLYTDAHRVRQVLINFLTNANKYTTEGEIHLHVALSKTHEAVTFSVTDTGSGIAGDMSERIFERFEKLDSMKQGTGLGLNICRLIAHYLNGSVALDTTYGGPDKGDGSEHGCRFLFTHPVSTAEDATDKAETSTDKAEKSLHALYTDESTSAHADKRQGGLKSILLALMLSCTLGITAQDNIYKIDNHLYNELQRLTALRTTPKRCLEMGDSLIKVAETQKQWKAECIFVTTLINVLAQEKMYDRDALYTARLKELGMKHHLTQYTYWGWIHDIVTDINTRKLRQAQEKSAEMMALAQSTNDPYGKVQSHRIVGQLYYARNLPVRAAEYYEEAAQLCQRLTPDQDAAILWTRAAECFMNIANKQDKFNENISKALKSAKTEGTLLDIYDVICRHSFHNKDTERFIETWAIYDPLAKKLSRQNTTHYRYLLAINYIITEQFDKAQAIIDQTSDKDTRLRLKIFMDEKKEDWGQHLTNIKQFTQYTDSLHTFYQIAELAEMESELGSYALKDSIEKERLRALRLQEQEEQLKMEALRLAADSMQRTHLTDSLELLAAQAQLEMAQAEAETQRHSDEAAAQHHKSQTLALYIVLAGLLIILVLGAFILLRNVRTSRRLRRINQQLTIAKAEALQTDEKKTNFIHSVSHEVRTPLNAIVGSCELLCLGAQELTDSEKSELRHSINSNTRLLTALVNDILALSRIESEKTKVVLSTANIHDLLTDLYQMAQQRETPNVKAMLIVDESLDAEASITTDPNLLKQMIDQLLSNAFKFTEQGEVRIVAKPGYLAIEDTGRGIPASEADTIFDRFYKTDRFTQGTGLGLALVKAIADRLKIHVYVDKAYAGPGARFIIEP